MIGSILTVCTGNICRSPLAEALLAKEMPRLRVESAGVGALVGAPADPHAIAVAEQAGLDITGHRARQITREMAAAFDLVLVMSQDHRTWLMRQLPDTSGKVYLLGHWDDGTEVPDPFMRSRKSFERVFEQIRQHVGSWEARLANGIRDPQSHG